jgi:hypothetical protein
MLDIVLLSGTIHTVINRLIHRTFRTQQIQGEKQI